ncbi:hypothetical protein GCM10010080_06120 [Thermomonas carbonis]|nr:hypothetical protein GCM10010080_06120 [Thermomonas carbonis]
MLTDPAIANADHAAAALMQTLELTVENGDGHRCDLITRIPAAPPEHGLWLAGRGMGMPTRHYLPFAGAPRPHAGGRFRHEWRRRFAAGPPRLGQVLITQQYLISQISI